MATTRQVESADGRYHKPPRPTFTEGTDHTHVLANPHGTPQNEAQERADARMFVRRLANRHGCPGRCEAPEHADDVAAGAEWLDALFTEPHPKRKSHKKRSTA